ncbi:MAG: helix-turn-helix transcriptional regulator [Firmicutes bacterium]|nr:helix-turn-helix transcriptional regulator [Bacillota bacterium]
MMRAKALFMRNLKYYMKERGITQIELARRISVSPATVSDWVNGKKPASYDNLDVIADVLNTTVANLFLDRFSGGLYDTALDEELKSFIRSRREAEWVVRDMMKLSPTELRAYRNILEQIKLVKKVNKNPDEDF